MNPNPLLDFDGHPRFRDARPEHVEPAIRELIGAFTRTIEERISDAAPPTWESLVAPILDAEERLDRAYSIVDHLVHVAPNEPLRAAHRAVTPLVAEVGTRRHQDGRLARAFEAIRARADADGLSAERRKVLDDELREFRLAGAHLGPAEKERAAAIRVELSNLAVTFAQHVTDSADRFRLVVERPEQVAGLPEPLVAAARAQALRDDPAAPPERWSFTLHMPVYLPFLTHQRDRGLRERIYRAFAERATQGADDNAPLMRRTAALRAEFARLVGFGNYAELALTRRMAKTPDEVHAFLEDLAARARPFAARERDELARIARERDGVETLERWDIPHYREVLRRERFDFSDDEVAAYLPADRVVAGFSEVVRRLFGATVEDRTADPGFQPWHPDVRVLAILGEDGSLLGHVYADLYARDGKQTGAWVGGLVARKRLADGSIRTPVATLVCNFTPPAPGRPSLLRHEEARTFFHEFGHALHHVLTRTEEVPTSGTHGVPRDGVEFPSQFLENWVWHEEPLALISSHAESGAPLPAALREKMLAAKNHLRATDIVRQMELALSDFELHMRGDAPDEAAIRAHFLAVRRRVHVLPTRDWDRFENGFLHIFAGGYAAGYYGYAWAEVLAADAWERFQEEGVWSREAARDFREEVLAKGGSADFMDLYVAFRGRRPDPGALLRSAGLQ